MEYQIHISEEEYIRFNIFHNTNSKQAEGTRITLMLFAILLPVLTVCNVLLVLLQVKTNDILFLTASIFGSLLYILWYIYYPKILERKVRLSIKRLKASGKLPYRTDFCVEFQDEKIVMTSEYGKFYVFYKDIEKICIQKDCFYIYYSITEAVIIPFHCLGGDKERVLSYVSEKAPSPPKKA